MLFALLQLHVANPDNLAHEADAGSDEVCAAEVLQGQREQKRMSPYITLSHSFLFSLYNKTPFRAYFLMLKYQKDSSLPPIHPRTIIASEKNDCIQKTNF